LPIIALTARSRTEGREQCLAAGMDDSLAKPIQAAELEAAIEQVVGTSDRPISSLLDPRMLFAACGGDEVILDNICQAFQTHLPEHVKTVWDALSEKNAPRLREAAHKRTEMLAAFSTVGGGAASDLEEHAARRELEPAPALVEQLEALAQELIKQAGGLSLKTLRQQTEHNDDSDAASGTGAGLCAR
jgi:CheY-like chemotaxis protein